MPNNADQRPVMFTADHRDADSLAAHFLGVLPAGPSSETVPDYGAAFRAWENLLGAVHVRADEATRYDYSKTTLPKGTRPAGVIRPHTTEEVGEAVNIARRFNVPLHAISRGKNWGYGDACAAADGYVIVELTRMNRIRELNVELGYAVVEPGVSQGQMYEYLQENRIPLLLDVTGAGPDASIVGNILQRGFGHTPYGDRFRNTSGLEVVLPDGRLLRTGFGQFDQAKAAHVFPWGVGPWIDGLFTQSSLGIVTAASVWLMPRPEVIEGFACKIEDGSNLGDLLDALRRLRMGGTVRSTVHVANDLRVLSSRMRYPWERARGARPIPPELRGQLRQEHGLGLWNMLGASYGTSVEVRAARKVIRQALGDVTRVRFFRRTTLNRVQRVARLLEWSSPGRRLVSTIAAASSAFDLLEGIPNAEHLQGAFWGYRDPSGDRGGDLRDAGLIWVSSVLPLEARAAGEVLGIVEPIFAEYKFDPLVTMTAVTERALCCVMSIHFDKRNAPESQSARQCAVELHERLAALGYHPYRRASTTRLATSPTAP